jgi:hypothetical protein
MKLPPPLAPEKNADPPCLGLRATPAICFHFSKLRFVTNSGTRCASSSARGQVNYVSTAGLLVRGFPDFLIALTCARRIRARYSTNACKGAPMRWARSRRHLRGYFQSTLVGRRGCSVLFRIALEFYYPHGGELSQWSRQCLRADSIRAESGAELCLGAHRHRSTGDRQGLEYGACDRGLEYTSTVASAPHAFR